MGDVALTFLGAYLSASYDMLFFTFHGLEDVYLSHLTIAFYNVMSSKH